MSTQFEWNQYLLSTIDEKYASTARRRMDWYQMFGNVYRSSAGEHHVCDQNCIRWVYRQDGVKICAITGLSKNSSHGMPSKLTRMKRQAVEIADESPAMNMDWIESVCIDNDTGSIAREPLKKRRSAEHSPVSMEEKGDVDVEMGPEIAGSSLESVRASPSLAWSCTCFVTDFK